MSGLHHSGSGPYESESVCWTIDPTLVESVRDLGGEDLVRELIQAFLEDSSYYLERLRASLADSEAAGATSAAYYLRAGASVMGADLLCEACAEVERAARAGDLSLAPPLLEEVEARFRKVSEALTKYSAG